MNNNLPSELERIAADQTNAPMPSQNVDVGAVRTMLWQALGAYAALLVGASVWLALSNAPHMGWLTLGAGAYGLLMVAAAIGLGDLVDRLRALKVDSVALDMDPSALPDLRRIKTLTTGTLTLDIERGRIMRWGQALQPALERGTLVLPAPTLGIDPDKGPTALQLWTIAQANTDVPIQLSLPQHSTPLVYWALWQICRKNGWGLKSSFGSQSAKDLQSHASERIGRQLGWIQGIGTDHNGAQSIDGRTAQGQNKPIPLCELNTPKKTVYAFPQHVSPQAQATHALDVDRWLRFVIVVCALGLVTLPLALVVHFIRSRTPTTRHTIAIDGSTLTINGRRQPLHALQYISAIPVHEGPPMILTERSALSVGGLYNYEDRVTWGKHILERVALSLGDRRFEAATKHPTAPFPKTLRPPALPLANRWRREISARAFVSLLVLLPMGLANLIAMKSWWAPWMAIAKHDTVLIPTSVPWCTLIGTAILLGLGAMTVVDSDNDRIRRWLTVFHVPTWVLVAAVLAGLSPSTEDHILDISNFRTLDKPVHINTLLPLLSHPQNAFNKKDLRHIDMTRAELKDLRIEDSNLQGVSMRQARFQRLSLYRSDLSDTDLTGASFKSCVWIDITAQGANFSKIKGPRLRLLGAKLEHALFEGADLSNARLKDSTLTSANFNDANLEMSDLRGIKAAKVSMERADLSGANLAAAYLHSAKMSKANLASSALTHANLSHSTLLETNFHNASLRGTQMDHVKASGADFKDATLIDVDLSRADLSGTNFSGAKILRSDLTDANLTGADLTGVDLAASNLSGADLTGATLPNTQHKGLKFSADTICPSGQHSAADTFCPKPPTTDP